MHKNISRLTDIILKFLLSSKKLLTFRKHYDILNVNFGTVAREVWLVEEKYGKKLGEAKPLMIAVSGMLMVAAVFLIAGIAVLGYSISKGGFNFVSIPLLIVGIVLLVYCIKTMQGGVTCYENAVVIKETFKTTEIPRDEIAAIYWERPGASASNEKMRTNANIADIIMAGGRRHFKVSDGYYSNVDVLGLYQDRYKIPQEIKR